MSTADQDLAFLIPRDPPFNITASSEDGDHVAANLLDAVPTTLWRTTTLPNPTITVDRQANDPAVTSWDIVVLWGVNLSSTGNWQVTAAASEAGLAAPTFSSGALTGWPAGQDLTGYLAITAFLFLDTARTERWVRLTINEPNPVLPLGVVTPFIRAARLYITEAFQPLRGGQTRGSTVREAGATTSPLSAAHPSASRGALVQDISGSCDYLETSELPDVREVQSRGLSRDLMVFRDLGDTSTTQAEHAYGAFDQQSLQGPNSTEGPDRYSWRWKVLDMGTVREPAE